MTASLFERITYGKPLYAGLTGPAWQHRCGNVVDVDLLDDDHLIFPWDRKCVGCQWHGRDGWRPLFTFTGPCCDQCHGNGWVPISGKVDGAMCGYDTVTECTACGGTGMASSAQAGGAS